MTWRDISTAPRDGTEIFVWGCIESSPLSRPHIGIDDFFRAAWNEGWQATDHDGWICGATHWQPLPAPPETTPEAERLAVMEGK